MTCFGLSSVISLILLAILSMDCMSSVIIVGRAIGSRDSTAAGQNRSGTAASNRATSADF